MTSANDVVSILLPDLRGGGAERVNINLANEMARRGLRVELVLVSAAGEFIDDVDPRIRIVDLGCERLREVIGPLRRYLVSVRPVSLLACMWPLTTIAVLARLLARVPTRVIAAEHITWSKSHVASSGLRRLFVRAIMRATLPLADRVVIVSHGARRDLLSFAGLPPDLVTVIYNPVVAPACSRGDAPTAPAEWCVGPHKKVLAVGSLKEQKDFPTLLEAFAKVVPYVDARLLILGEGELRGEIEEEIRRLGLSDRVSLFGFVRSPAPYFRHADLFVLSSLYEGLPTVLIEALAAGTPIVSTDCPSGPHEILNGGELGILVPVSDSVALADAMVRSLKSQHDASSKLARAADFSIGAATDQYLELLLPAGRQRP